jgi:threonine dehydratase
MERKSSPPNLNKPTTPGNRSLKRKFIPSLHPDTIADGLRTSLGTFTFPIILDYVENIVTVPEASIVRAMRLVWERMKIMIETSSAVFPLQPSWMENGFDDK